MDTSRSLLRTAMAANAAFSFATGALLTIAPGSVAAWLDVSIDGWLRLLGIALLGHGALLVLLAARADWRRWASVNLAAIAPYPALMLLVVLLGWVERPLGVALVLFDGAVVGAIAGAHAMGLREGVGRHQAQPA